MSEVGGWLVGIVHKGRGGGCRLSLFLALSHWEGEMRGKKKEKCCCCCCCCCESEWGGAKNGAEKKKKTGGKV